MRRKWSWTDLQEGRAREVLTVVMALKKYWPLTLRQTYYQLVINMMIKNMRSNYTSLSKLVKWMRIDERLPWEALEDRSRRITEKRGFESVEQFIEQEKQYLFNGYTRCLVQSQPKHIEVWVEKDALMRIFEDTVCPYCIRAVVCRGYQSVVKKYGTTAYELDALHPEILEGMIKKAVEDELDMIQFQHENNQEIGDLYYVKKLRAATLEAVSNIV